MENIDCLAAFVSGFDFEVDGKSNNGTNDGVAENIKVEEEATSIVHRYIELEKDKTPCQSDHSCKLYCNGFSGSRDLKEHETPPTKEIKEKPYQCGECGRNFITSHGLKNHMKKHTGEKSDDYKTSDKGLNESCSLKNPVIQCSDEEHCKEPDLSCVPLVASNSSHDLEKHLQKQTDEKPFKCEECGKGFNDEGYFKKHLRIHTGEKPFECDECGKKFCWSNSLARHKALHYVKKIFKCIECGEEATDISTSNSHMETPNQCEKCGGGLKEVGTFKKHTCEECGKGFNDPRCLRAHIRTHTGEKPYQCEVCGKGFNDSYLKKRHMRNHTGEKPYQCQECGKRLIDRSSFRTHMAMHTGEKRFKCEVCGKGFINSFVLKNHVTIHTGEKPYRCEECGKEFRQRHNLKLHMKVHGEKAFQCEVCCQLFSQSYTLKNHMIIHTGEKPHKCEECGKGFRRKGDLKQHLDVHARHKQANQSTN